MITSVINELRTTSKIVIGPCLDIYFLIQLNTIKLLSENKLIICAIVHLHYHISTEKFEPESGLELGPPDL